MCGIVGLVANKRKQASYKLYDALTVIQHRGQDAAGMATCRGDHLYLRTNNGLVRDVFRDEHMLTLQGHMGIAHCRYPTAGTASSTEAQPFYVNSPYGIVMAHNGNLTNTSALIKELYQVDLRHLNTNSDSEVLLNVFAHELAIIGEQQLKIDTIFTAVKKVHQRCKGAYAVVSMILGYGVLGFRDPHGIRPLIIGKRKSLEGEEWMIASESVALTSMGFEIYRDVEPGEAVFIDKTGGIYTHQCAAKTNRLPCVFEYVYLARPDSIMDGVSVYEARLRMGEALAEKIKKEWPLEDIDVVIPIPDTSRTAAHPIAERLGIPYREGFIKNRYIARTFIMPQQSSRKDSIRKKLNPIPSEFKNRNVLLVDDSIVRGNTSKKIVEMARQAGAKKVFFASAAPPIRFPNVYGIDMPVSSELIAYKRNTQDIAEALNVDALIYQDLPDLIQAVTQDTTLFNQCEASCFSGAYITGDVSQEYLHGLAQNRNDGAKQHQTNTVHVVK